jgi:hypothetical protein
MDESEINIYFEMCAKYNPRGESKLQEKIDFLYNKASAALGFRGATVYTLLGQEFVRDFFTKHLE